MLIVASMKPGNNLDHQTRVVDRTSVRTYQQLYRGIEEQYSHRSPFSLYTKSGNIRNKSVFTFYNG